VVLVVARVSGPTAVLELQDKVMMGGTLLMVLLVAVAALVLLDKMVTVEAPMPQATVVMACNIRHGQPQHQLVMVDTMLAVERELTISVMAPQPERLAVMAVVQMVIPPLVLD
jgi:hypothetical protein